MMTSCLWDFLLRPTLKFMLNWCPWHLALHKNTHDQENAQHLVSANIGVLFSIHNCFFCTILTHEHSLLKLEVDTTWIFFGHFSNELQFWGYILTEITKEKQWTTAKNPRHWAVWSINYCGCLSSWRMSLLWKPPTVRADQMASQTSHVIEGE